MKIGESKTEIFLNETDTFLKFQIILVLTIMRYKSHFFYFLFRGGQVKQSFLGINYPKSGDMGFFPTDSSTSSKQPW